VALARFDVEESGDLLNNFAIAIIELQHTHPFSMLVMAAQLSPGDDFRSTGVAANGNGRNSMDLSNAVYTQAALARAKLKRVVHS